MQHKGLLFTSLDNFHEFRESRKVQTRHSNKRRIMDIILLNFIIHLRFSTFYVKQWKNGLILILLQAVNKKTAQFVLNGINISLVIYLKILLFIF